MENVLPFAEKLAFSIAEAERATGLSKPTLYRLMKSGELRFAQIKGRRLIPRSALLELIGEAAA